MYFFCVCFSEVYVLQVDVQHCQLVQWNYCQFRSSFQTVLCRRSGTNECMQSEEEMGIMYYQSDAETAVMLLDFGFFKVMNRSFSSCFILLQ